MRRITLAIASSAAVALLTACSAAETTYSVINEERLEEHHIDTTQEIGTCTVLDEEEGCSAEATIEALPTVETVGGVSDEEVAEALGVSLESQLPSGIFCDTPDHEVEGGIMQVFPVGALWSYQIQETDSDGDQTVSETLHTFIPRENSVACGKVADFTE